MSQYKPECWSEGEQVIFAALCAATGAVEGRTAFKGLLPPQLDAWALVVGGGTQNTTFKDARPPTEIKFDGILQGQFSATKRDMAQSTAMKWLTALPIANQEDATQVVYVARATAPPDIEWGYIPVLDDQGREKHKIGCWVIRMPIEAVLRTHY
jgi:hypothetical protein